jgi:L-alanine-DL-glutamate epimerase-like enolase superfamily enzyme
MLLDQETFHIIEARERKVRPLRLDRPFRDATGGPFRAIGTGAFTITDSDGATGEALCVDGGDVFDILITHLLTETPVPYEQLYSRLYWSIRNTGFRGRAASVLGAVDRALHDLAARRAGKPLHRFMGATRDWVAAYASGGGTNLSDAELIGELAGYAQQGFRTVKMKVGTDFGRQADRDVLRVTEAHRVLGGDVRIAIDANQCWSAAEAMKFIERVAHCNIAWFEEPVHSADLEEIRAFCRTSPVEVAFGESERCDKVFPSLVNAGAKHLQPNPLDFTGVAEWCNVRDLARERGLALSLPGTPHYGAAFGATATEDTLMEILFPVVWGFTGLFSRQPRLNHGRFELDLEPGSPVQLDWERLRREDRIVRDKIWRRKDVAGAGALV